MALGIICEAVSQVAIYCRVWTGANVGACGGGASGFRYYPNDPEGPRKFEVKPFVMIGPLGQVSRGHVINKRMLEKSGPLSNTPPTQTLRAA